jgi:hypothetical protein
MLRTSLLLIVSLLVPAIAAAQADQTPPDPVTDVTAESGKTTIALIWINTGDDGSVGTAEEYQVRISTSPITNRHSGSLLASDAPGPSGSQGCANATGLACNTTFYLAVFLRDDHNNWSSLGTVVQIATQGCNTILEKQCFNLLKSPEGTSRVVGTGGADEERPAA